MLQLRYKVNLKITSHFALHTKTGYIQSCNATEVTTHTGQNNHLFFAVILL